MDPEILGRRQKERRLRFYEDDQTSCVHVVPMEWYKSWVSFVVGDTGPPTTPIDNSGFVLDGSPAYHLLNFRNVVLQSEHQWNVLSSIYGGGPHIVWDCSINDFVIHE
eukprot:TRINITY_DN9059_c0_g1_i18.p1 TRINITY_DN9059_c0_g1~~TRINITY_DN9059_c0_g1_i18.p1  ORF type:complete len:108 (-),score=21.15 TRINITY_DN9059_c0_g1_i18:338-661(-)